MPQIIAFKGRNLLPFFLFSFLHVLSIRSLFIYFLFPWHIMISLLPFSFIFCCILFFFLLFFHTQYASLLYTTRYYLRYYLLCRVKTFKSNLRCNDLSAKYEKN